MNLNFVGTMDLDRGRLNLLTSFLMSGQWTRHRRRLGLLTVLETDLVE
jgi:hypothetical protein